MWRPRLKDPADEMVLETAVKGAADWPVTFNLRDLADAAREFEIRVAPPCDAWREIRRHEKKYCRFAPTGVNIGRGASRF